MSDAVQLLVDGDQHSIKEIEMAARLAGSAEAVVFAAPGRLNNRKWQHFFQGQGVTFRPVQREDSEKPGDAAIIAAMELFIAGPSSRTALLAADRDFAPVVCRAAASGKEVMVIVPEKRIHVADLYRPLPSVQVQLLKPDTPSVSKVKAVLYSGGRGKVQLCRPIAKQNRILELAYIKARLTDLGYCQPDQQSGFMVSPIAKFWHANRVDPLVVYPLHCGITQLHAVLAETGTVDWKPYTAKSAFCLPSRWPRKTKKKIDRFGSTLAAAIHAGGGPFILCDASDLASKALRRLGYPNWPCDSDVREALLVFINSSSNKYKLREMGLLPCRSDTVADVQSKIRRAFLNSNSSGEWQLGPADSRVRRLLSAEKMLSSQHADKAEMLYTMKKYLKQKRWPDMNSYIGCVWCIYRHLNLADPSRRSLVEFDA